MTRFSTRPEVRGQRTQRGDQLIRRPGPLGGPPRPPPLPRPARRLGLPAPIGAPAPRTAPAVLLGDGQAAPGASHAGHCPWVWRPKNWGSGVCIPGGSRTRTTGALEPERRGSGTVELGVWSRNSTPFSATGKTGETCGRMRGEGMCSPRPPPAGVIPHPVRVCPAGPGRAARPCRPWPLAAWLCTGLCPAGCWGGATTPGPGPGRLWRGGGGLPAGACAAWLLATGAVAAGPARPGPP